MLFSHVAHLSWLKMASCHRVNKRNFPSLTSASEKNNTFSRNQGLSFANAWRYFTHKHNHTNTHTHTHCSNCEASIILFSHTPIKGNASNPLSYSLTVHVWHVSFSISTTLLCVFKVSANPHVFVWLCHLQSAHNLPSAVQSQ